MLTCLIAIIYSIAAVATSIHLWDAYTGRILKGCHVSSRVVAIVVVDVLICTVWPLYWFARGVDAILNIFTNHRGDR